MIMNPKYFYKDDDNYGTIYFAPYFEHLKTIREQVPDYIYQYFLNEDNYVLQSDTTLHDARFYRFITHLKRTKLGNAYEQSMMDITLELVHYDYENIIQLKYIDAEIKQLSAQLFQREYHQTDLLLHELDVAEEQEFLHTMYFDHDLLVEIQFKDFMVDKFPVPEKILL